MTSSGLMAFEQVIDGISPHGHHDEVDSRHNGDEAKSFAGAALKDPWGREQHGTEQQVTEGDLRVGGNRVAVLDAFLAIEPNARVACETFATTGRVVVGGEVGLSDPAKLAAVDEAARTTEAELAQARRDRAGASSRAAAVSSAIFSSTTAGFSTTRSYAYLSIIFFTPKISTMRTTMPTTMIAAPIPEVQLTSRDVPV